MKTLVKILILVVYSFFFVHGISSGQTSDLDKYFPSIHIIHSNNPSPGYYFIATKKHYVDTVNYFAVVDNYGTPVYFRVVNDMAAGVRVTDGYIYMLEGPEKVYFKIDSLFQKIDTFNTQGYKLDGHDFALDDQGHSLMMGRKLRMVDLSAYGGQTDATVKDLVVQEFDENHTLLYTWKAWEHFEITDANENSPYVDLTASTVDYLHANSVCFDSDTSFLLSCRHFDEITKIDRRTGDIIWRLGGKHNRFTFLNDTLHFSHPHTIRKMPNGDILIFDNGNLHDTAFSSVVEYKLDEQMMTATLVRRLHHRPEVFADHGGGEALLPGGNMLVYWGQESPSFTEYHPDGSVAIEMDYSSRNFSSRVAKSLWKHKVFVTAVDTVYFGMWDGYTESEYLLTLYNNTDSTLKITGYQTHTPYFKIKETFPVEIPAHGNKNITVAFFPQDAQTGYIADVLTIQSEYPHLYLAQQVVLTGKMQDTQPPVAVIMPDTTNVPRDALVVIDFSEPVCIAGGTELDYLNVDTLVLLKKDGPDGLSVEYNADVTTDKKRIVITPADSLGYNQTYFVMIRNELLTDYTGNQLLPASEKFSTGPEITAVRLAGNHSIRIYPNPSAGRIEIVTDVNIPWNIRVFTLLGTLIAEKERVIGHYARLNLQHLNPGMYFVVVTANGRKIKTEKIIVKH